MLISVFIVPVVSFPQTTTILHRTCRKILHRPLIRFRNVDIS